MQKCERCGNAYGHTFQVLIHGKTHHFDSFECAIELLAPRCHQCGTRIIGHGLESESRIYCCAHCARAQGILSLKDHADERSLS
ncbi:MAG: hypothetical protein ACXVLQ_12580 [Bacteriovorax sp.]